MSYLRSYLNGGVSWRSFALFDAANEGGAAAAPGAAAAGAAAAAGGAAPGVKVEGGGAAPAAGADAGAAAAAAAAAAAGGDKAGDKTGTIAGGAAKPPVIAATAKWPDNWREELAGGDAAKLNILKRYDSPAAFAASGFELRNKMDKGELKAPAKPLAADAKPEEIAAWRKEQGLPETAEAYVGQLKLPNGLVPGEGDKPLLASFAKEALASNLDQATFDKVTGWYFQQQAEADAARVKADGQFHSQSLVALGQEWGKEFEANNNAVTNLINTLPEGIRDHLLTARTAEGFTLGDHPEFNRAMLMLAKQVNPAAAVLPASSGGTLSGVESRIAEIEAKHMRAPQGTPEHAQYWAGESGAKMQEEYRTLLTARETMNARKSGAA